MPIPLVLRLFLPETWIQDPERLQHAGVPEGFWTQRSKPEIALEELKRLLQAGVSFGAVLADAGYGMSAPFRQGLSALGLLWAAGIARIQKVYPADVQMIAAPPTRGRPRKTPIPDEEAVAAGDYAGEELMAADHMAARDQGAAAGEVRRHARAGGRWA